MPNDMLTNDTMVASIFFLEIDGNVMTSLISVNGLESDYEVVTTKQVTKDGKLVTMKTRGNGNLSPDLTLTRLAPVVKAGDGIWDWFELVAGGMAHGKRADYRKTGSVVVYDSSKAEVARYNFTDAWPSKISTSDFSIDGSSPVTETITLVTESLMRTK